MNDWLPGTEEHYADLPGLRMHYVTAGDPAGFPVVLLHGFPEFWYSWRHQMPALAEAGYRVIAPDQRGYNLTDQKPPYNLETLVGDIAALHDHLGIERSHIVGHDWGGVTAWGFAAYHPDRTAKLAIMNAPHPNAYLDACKRVGQVFRSWYMYFFQLPWLPEKLILARDGAVVRRVFGALPRDKMTETDIERYLEALRRPGALTAMINWYRALPRETIKHGGSLPNPAIEAPTCVIWGERDPALGKGCNRTLPQYVPDLRVHYLPKATHWVQIDHPGEVNRLLLEFLQEDGPARQ